MQEERNILMQDVLEHCKHYCMSRGVSLFFVDLRWGITKQEQEEGKVLELCLNEIDNCRPFFIGFLGHRY